MVGQVHAAALPWRFAGLALALSLLVALGYVTLRDSPTASTIEGQTLTWRFALRQQLAPVPAPQQVAIVAIDNRTVEAMGRWPLPRRALAAIVDRLAAAGATAIGVDLLFADPEPSPAGAAASSGDEMLIEALRRSDRSVMALAFTFGPNAPPGAAALRIVNDAAYRVVVNTPQSADDHTLTATGMLMPI